MPRDDLPSAERCEEIFHAALGAGDVKGVEAALLVMAVQDPRRAGKLFETTKVALDLVAAAESGQLGFTTDDLRRWLGGEQP